MNENIYSINKILEPLKHRAMNMVGRAVVQMVEDDHKKQELQIALTAGELRDQVERFQNYGFTSHPHNGAEAAVVFVGGNRDHGLILAVDDRRYRMKAMAQGEVAIYTDEGDYIHLKRGGNMEIKAGTKLVIDCPRVEVTGDLIDQTGGGNGNTVQAMRDIFNGHTHPGDSGGITGSPNQSQ